LGGTKSPWSQDAQAQKRQGPGGVEQVDPQRSEDKFSSVFMFPKILS